MKALLFVWLLNSARVLHNGDVVYGGVNEAFATEAACWHEARRLTSEWIGTDDMPMVKDQSTGKLNKAKRHICIRVQVQ